LFQRKPVPSIPVVPRFIRAATEITTATFTGGMGITLTGGMGTTPMVGNGITPTEGTAAATGAVGTMAVNITTAATTPTTRPSL
jgi:hypothetical protein